MANALSGVRLSRNYRGSDCTGADGTANRTLTVNGPLLDSALVIVGGRVLHPTEDYTTSANVITFLVVIDDTDYIRAILEA